MCIVFNTIGCLNDIQKQLDNHNIDEFSSVDELINFQKTCHFTQEQIILEHTQQIEKEKIILYKEITELKDNISTRKRELQEYYKERLLYLDRQIENLPIPDSKAIPILKDYYLNLIIWLNIWFTQIKHFLKIFFISQQSNKFLSKKNNRLNYITTNFTEAVNQNSSAQLQILQQKITIINEINNSIYGAIGEQKVVNILKNLSDDYILINDFICSFQTPIYNRKENDYIKSIQIDHLLVSPSGIFIIETKNWSEHTINNLNLHSPVQQVKRTNFALFKILADEIKNLNLRKHNWGDRKIPIRNLIVFINNKPIEEFQFVKILSLTQLLSHIEYFKPSFSFNETQMIADFLFKISDKRKQSNLIIQ
ncbi:nuclease-related domain-containing protein [Flavobacterium sp. A45]|uniref:nuclease-related domain-containing protein n=1 Tax=Flavobacterium sp. A45 TaxID=1945862 RepID=UPI00098508B3|nr:nuclease-related domain-containing protein [Flavobacterium sp. A45]OOG68910.1 hypothetical protein B0E44_12680 [Flavobacterium sp. A45]